MTILQAGRYQLRPFTPADAPEFAAAVRESGDTVGRWMGWAHGGFTQEEALRWFDACVAGREAGTMHEFGIFDGQQLVGGAGLNQFNTVHGFCNLGYWIRESAQRRGAALAAVRALAPYAFEALGQTRVEIVIAEGNEPSIGVALKAGAVREGVARNRLLFRGVPVAAHVLSLVPPPAVRIRPMRVDEIPAARALLRRAAEEFILPESTPEGAAAFLAEQSEDAMRRFMAEGYVYHVAEVQGELAGFIGIQGRTHVYHLFVDKRWHRRGLARRLWEAGREAALLGHHPGDHPGFFTVNSSNHAVGFYASLGFARTAPMQAASVLYNPMRLEIGVPADPVSGLAAALVDPA